MMRKTDNYYVFVNKEFNRFFTKEYLNREIKININNYDYLINFTDEEIKNFKVISKRDDKNFEILEI